MRFTNILTEEVGFEIFFEVIERLLVAKKSEGYSTVWEQQLWMLCHQVWVASWEMDGSV